MSDGDSGNVQEIPEVTITGTPMDEAGATEYLHHVLDGTHILGGVAECAEVFGVAEAFPAAAGAVEVLGPVGWAASLILMAWEVYDAFNTQNNIDKNMGKCYGVLFQIHGMADTAAPALDYEFGVDHNRSYWFEGLAEGRQHIANAAVHNRVLLLCARHGDAAVLNTLWQEVCQGRHPESYFVLGWPTPGVTGANMG
jgi:hypothetical protein